MPHRRLIRLLRTTPVPRLLAFCAALVAVCASGVAIALAAGSGPVPPPKPTAQAIHDALAAPEVQGISADVRFTNHLVSSSTLEGAGPILTGATGRVWVGAGHRFRLELQSDRGDAQIVSDGTQVTAYDATTNTAYRVHLPARAAGRNDHANAQVPTVAEIQADLDRVMRDAGLSPATPSNVAGQPAYTVRVTPRRDGGLVGGAELAWDAARGVPLRVAVFAAGDSTPVLALEATGISYGPVPASRFDVTPPAGAKIVNFDAAGLGNKDHAGKDRPPTVGVDAVSRAVPFKLAAPDTLAGMQRSEVRLIDWGDHPAALVRYGQGLGGIAVIERAADAANPPGAPHGDHAGGLSLPSVSIGGTPGQELSTPLGTLVRFSRGGVDDTVLGSVTAATAEAAARGL
jgi:outer membrane lipoprotein-sorting protein